MKRLITIAALLLLVVAASAQTKVIKDVTGNFTVAKGAKSTDDKKVGVFTNPKGEMFDVFESVNGKLYYWRTSRNGNVYRCYLKTV